MQEIQLIADGHLQLIMKSPHTVADHAPDISAVEIFKANVKILHPSKAFLHFFCPFLECVLSWPYPIVGGCDLGQGVKKFIYVRSLLLLILILISTASPFMMCSEIGEC